MCICLSLMTEKNRQLQRMLLSLCGPIRRNHSERLKEKTSYDADARWYVRETHDWQKTLVSTVEVLHSRNELEYMGFDVCLQSSEVPAQTLAGQRELAHTVFNFCACLLRERLWALAAHTIPPLSFAGPHVLESDCM